MEMPEMTVIQKLTMETGYPWRSNKGWREVSFMECLLLD